MARLDFLWQLQARDEKLDMEALQVTTTHRILAMILTTTHRILAMIQANPHRILSMIMAMILVNHHRILLNPYFAELQQEDPLQPTSGPRGHTLPG